METLYDYIIDIVSKRIPVEGVNVKAEQIVHKIKLLPFPEDVVEADKKTTKTVELEDGTKKEETVVIPRNTNEKALVLITVPQVEEEEEVKIEVTGAAEGEAAAADTEAKEKTKTVVKLVDVDQQDKALAVTTRSIQGYESHNFWSINVYAGKAYREEFLEYINRTHPEFFEENDDQE